MWLRFKALSKTFPHTFKKAYTVVIWQGWDIWSALLSPGCLFTQNSDYLNAVKWGTYLQGWIVHRDYNLKYHGILNSSEEAITELSSVSACLCEMRFWGMVKLVLAPMTNNWQISCVCVPMSMTVRLMLSDYLTVRVQNREQCMRLHVR